MKNEPRRTTATKLIYSQQPCKYSNINTKEINVIFSSVFKYMPNLKPVLIKLVHL